MDYEYLTGANGETVVKEHCVTAKDVLHIFHFRNPHPMIPHGSEEIGTMALFLTTYWKPLSMRQLQDIDHLYSYGATKCQFLSDLLVRPVLNLEDFGCPTRHKVGSGYSCVLPCHSFSGISCGTRNAHSFYEWMMYQFKTKSYVKCPKEVSRHDAMFISAI